MYIEYTYWVYFDIKFTMVGFENASLKLAC